MRGYQFIQCLDSDGQPLGRRRDLAKLAKPSVHTFQFRQPQRAGVRLAGSRPPVTLTFDKSGWDAWADAADAAEPLAGGAPYCLQGPLAGHLSRAWEVGPVTPSF